MNNYNKNNNVIYIGDNNYKVRIKHCKNSLIYFIENCLKIKLNCFQKILLKDMNKNYNKYKK
jgi:hypothetical protein